MRECVHAALAGCVGCSECGGSWAVSLWLCCHARRSLVVLVMIPVVPGQLRGMEKVSSPSIAPVQRWQHLPSKAEHPH